MPNSNGRLSTSVPRSPRLASKTQEGLVLSKEKNGLSSKIENLEKKMGDEITRKENEFSKMVDTLKDEAPNPISLALKPPALVHPIVDFFELNPCK